MLGRFPSSVLLVTLLASRAFSQQTLVSERVSFAPPIVFNSLGSYPTGIAAGDFNNDGIQDLIVGDLALSEGTVALGNGDGTFTSWKGGCGTGDPAGVVAVGKFDGQNLDALANDTEYGVAAMCLGDGTGYFSDGTFFIENQLTTVTGFAVGDFNRDHNQDLALVSDEQGFPVGQLLVYLGNGDGSFQQPKTFNTTTNPVAVATGDFNNDGNPDLVVLTNDTGDFGGYVAVLLGNGKGGFGAPHLFRIPKDHPNLGFSPPSAIAVGDFDGDKRLDVAIAISDWTASGEGYVVVLLGNGDGTLHRGQVAPAGQNPLSIFVADFNGDGIPDLVVGNVPCASGCGSLGSISVLLGRGDGTFRPRQTFDVNGSFPQITVADFNGDGKPDVATANGNSSTISILLNTTSWPRKAK
jgi:hypothetical protein